MVLHLHKWPLRLGYALGTVFVLCASNTYAAVIDNSAKTLEQQTAQTNVAALPAITVKAEQDDTYAGGQVATSSNVDFSVVKISRYAI